MFTSQVIAELRKKVKEQAEHIVDLEELVTFLTADVEKVRKQYERQLALAQAKVEMLEEALHGKW